MQVATATMRHVITVGALAAMLLVGCGPAESDQVRASERSQPRPAAERSEPGDTPVVSPSDPLGGWTPSRLDWVPCEELRRGGCASLTVPLDWSEPAGRTIDLELGRLPATGERIGSLVINPGGPGGSGLRYLGFEPYGPTITSRFDVVSWDPRGVGASDGLRCNESVPELLAADPDPDDDAELEALERAAAAVAQDCERLEGAVLDHLATTQVALDLEAIRRALGDEPLNYHGFSYGTQIGQEYLERFPGEVRAMVLDGVVDPALGFEEFLLGQVAAFDDAFRRDAARCQAEPAICGVADLEMAYDRIAERVELNPLPAEGGDVGPGELAIAAIQTSYGTDGWRTLGPSLAAALDGDGGPLRQLADTYFDFGGYASYAAVVCTDSPPPQGVEAYREFADRARERSGRFGGAVANELLPCATWGAAPSGTPRAISAPGAPPVLVVGNTGDAATPYENAVVVAERLESGVLVTVESEGHTAYGSNRCATEVIDTYLLSLSVPSDDPRCA